jgi:hypothetical protein
MTKAGYLVAGSAGAAGAFQGASIGVFKADRTILTRRLRKWLVDLCRVLTD